MCLLYFSVYIFRKWHRTLWRRTKKYTFPGTAKNFLRTQCGWEDMYNIKWGGLLAVKLWWDCRGALPRANINICLSCSCSIYGTLDLVGSSIQDWMAFWLTKNGPFYIPVFIMISCYKHKISSVEAVSIQQNSSNIKITDLT